MNMFWLVLHLDSHYRSQGLAALVPPAFIIVIRVFIIAFRSQPLWRRYLKLLLTWV